jgi:hemolysin activation/secretion protein
VVLTVKRGKPWRATLSADDSGLRATGQWQGNLHVSWDNPLGLSDLLSFGLNHDLTAYRKGSGTRGPSLHYSVPLGYWTFGASWSQSDFAQRIAGLERDYTSSGDARNLEVRAGYLFHRDQSRKDSLQLRLGNRLSRSFLEGTELDVQRRNDTFCELSLIHTQYFGAAQLDLTLAQRHGVSWFGAQPEPDPGGPTTRYRIRTLDATFSAPLHSLAYSATLRGQHTTDTLFASEYFTIGSRWTVRGFDGEATLAAENGAFLRNDLEGRLGRGASWYLGMDIGRVYGDNEHALPGRTLAGLVLGLKGVIKHRLHYNVFVGGPLRRPHSFAKNWPVVGVSASFQL